MKKERNDLLKSLPADFFKQFKTGEEFSGFMDAMFKRGVEEMPMFVSDAKMECLNQVFPI